MANAQLGSKAVGSIVKLKVGGAAKEFIVVHQGKPSSIYDESCKGTWLLMKDIYENRKWHSSNIVEPTATWCPSGSYSHKHGEQHKGMFTTDRAKNRAKTFPGIARAMAEQWGGDIREEL